MWHIHFILSYLLVLAQFNKYINTFVADFRITCLFSAKFSYSFFRQLDYIITVEQYKEGNYSSFWNTHKNKSYWLQNLKIDWKSIISHIIWEIHPKTKLRFMLKKLSHWITQSLKWGKCETKNDFASYRVRKSLRIRIKKGTKTPWNTPYLQKWVNVLEERNLWKIKWQAAFWMDLRNWTSIWYFHHLLKALNWGMRTKTRCISLQYSQKTREDKT